jgi:hypothetical protein
MHNLNGKTYSQKNIHAVVSAIDNDGNKANVSLVHDMAITFTRDPAACNLYQITKYLTQINVIVDGIKVPAPDQLTYGVGRVNCDGSLVMQTFENLQGIFATTYSELKIQKNGYLCGYTSFAGLISDPITPGIFSQISAISNLKLKQNC